MPHPGGTEALAVPLVMSVFFVKSNIPLPDRYLAQRYGEEFKSYPSHTRHLIPLVY
jgi:protein-S-isoprenylcysteine O-methyltransferase Ste14